MWRSARNYLAHAISSHPGGWYPFLSVYYLTYACDFRCPYCCDGGNTPYYRLSTSVLAPKQSIRLCSIIRGYTDYLVITGGEPLQYPGLDEVLVGLSKLKYDGIILTTNGYHLERHLEVLNQSVTHLVISLDTLDESKADRWYGRGPGTLHTILKNIARAALFPKRKFEIILCSVATPRNLSDIENVWAFCKERRLRLAVSPQLIGVKPNPELFCNPTYKNLYNLLISEKKKGQSINGTIGYLEHLRDLKKFSCRPSTVLAVSPLGDVFYPCLELGKTAGNLLDEPDLHSIRRHGIQRFGQEPICDDNRCHSPCALEFALLLQKPSAMLHEAIFQIKKFWSHRRQVP